MSTDSFVPLVHVVRGEILECVHYGAFVVADAEGNARTVQGNPDLLSYLRSAAKPFQLLPLVERGAADESGFGRRELAVMAASHSGEPLHTSLIDEILQRLGCGVGDLQCGAHEPYDEAAARALAMAGQVPTALHNNCSGKHTGMLALARRLGTRAGNYLDPDHPGQVLIRESVARWLGVEPGSLAMGVDGCGAPAYAAPLRTLARAFARLADPPADFGPSAGAARRVRDAMREHPELVGGTTGRVDTELMRLGHGLVAKGGAEGVLCVGIPPRDGQPSRGLALKIADGDAARRARGPATIAVLRELGVLDETDLEALGEQARPAVRNVAGRVVGEVRPVLGPGLHAGAP